MFLFKKKRFKKSRKDFNYSKIIKNYYNNNQIINEIYLTNNIIESIHSKINFIYRNIRQLLIILLKL